MRQFFLAISLMLCSIASFAGELGIEVVFSADEIRVIDAYYQGHISAGNDNKGKSKSLPPGIAKNLERGKPLPPGIAKRYLPTDLVNQLPVLPSGYERIIVDGKILLVEIATRVIHDILSDALLR